MNFNLDALIHLYPLLPPTLEEAVLLLLLELSAETLEIIRKMPLYKVRRLHYWIGYQLEVALCHHNQDSMMMTKSGTAVSVSDAPEQIIMMLWQQLQCE